MKRGEEQEAKERDGTINDRGESNIAVKTIVFGGTHSYYSETVLYRNTRATPSKPYVISTKPDNSSQPLNGGSYKTLTTDKQTNKTNKLIFDHVN